METNIKNIIELTLSTLIIILIFGKKIVIPLSTAFFLISSAIGIWLSLEQYRLKLESEKNEADVKLMTLFTKLMGIAHSRSGYIVSEKVIEKLFDKEIINKKDEEDLKKLNEKIQNVAVIALPVGAAEQNAAIVAIAELGIRHKILKNMAIEALKSISDFKPEISKKYLDKLSSD